MKSPALTSWEASGEYITYGPFQHQLFIKQVGSPGSTPEETLLLLHGFPESSYSYHAVLEGLSERFDRIILFDMIGYGLSDKPEENYSYSLLEQADTVLEVWKHFDIKGGHLLAHDMGDSVATEILARHELGLLPAWFSAGLQSLTFTNGSMVLDLAKLRITQKILLSRYGHLMKNLTTFKLFNHQVRSAHGNSNLSEAAVNTLWEANTLQNGHQKAYLTIKYLNDRKQFEKTRWLPALAQTQLPIHICWGDEDAVARVEMAYHLKEHVCSEAKLTIMKGLGHFCQLGSPEEWVEGVGGFYESLRE
jgi:pimeloyl-ACP methyl ester carboxylesterase